MPDFRTTVLIVGGGAGLSAVVVDRAGGCADGRRRTVRADYLIAADGAGSQIRQRLGIDVDGPGALYQTITAIVEADLNPALRGRRATIAYLQQPRPGPAIVEFGDACRFGADLGPAEAAGAYGIGEAGAMLVRPDGFVAWRAATMPADPAAELAGSLAGVLGGT